MLKKGSSVIFLYFIFILEVSGIGPGDGISGDSLKRWVYILASDSMAGRNTAEVGQKLAGQWIASYFKKEKLVPAGTQSFFQSYKILCTTGSNASLSIGPKRFEEGTDFFTRSLSESPHISSLDWKIQNRKEEFVPGFGWRKVSDYKPGVILSVKKWKAKPGLFSKEKKAYRPSWKSHFEEGVKAKVFISKKTMRQFIKHKGLAVETGYTGYTDTLTAENILGMVPGTSEDSGIIVISAHYDHLGIHDGKLYPGADDNASGTAAVMAIAGEFSRLAINGQRPKRSVVFVLFSGEEKGLWGSDYYTSHPVFPLEKTMTNLNIDMVGRIDSAHSGNPGYLYLIGSDRISRKLHEVSEEANREGQGLLLDYTYNDPADPNRFYYRSDHYNFAKNNIPVIFYFNGVHEDYHRPTDTADKIDFETMTKRTKMIFQTAWKLANMQESVKSNQP